MSDALSESHDRYYRDFIKGKIEDAMLSGQQKMGKFQKLANDVGAVVDKKNAAYGNSFFKTSEFLYMVYPNGIPTEQYNTALSFVRIFDKVLRIASDKKAFGEEPIKDLLGLVIRLLDQQQREEEKVEDGE